MGLHLNDVGVTLATTEISDWIESVELSSESGALEDTTMGDDWVSRIAGLKDWTVTINFIQDYAGSSLHSIIWPLFGTVAAITIIPEQTGGKSATNPSMEGNVVVSEYDPINASVDGVSTFSVSWPGAGTLSAVVA